MKISTVLETAKKLSAWGEPIENYLETRKVKDKDKKLPKLGASVYGVNNAETGDGGTE